MANIFGSIGLADTDRVFSAVSGQEVIYDIAREFVAEHNAQLDQVLSVFVARETQGFKERFKLPNNGMLGTKNTQGRYDTSKATGEWDVAFPLEDYGRELATNRVSKGYMSAEELSLHIQGIVNQNTNSVRFHVLKRLLNNGQEAFVDPLHGSINVEPLANGDTVTYPPIAGTNDEATDDHYLESNYLSAAVSDTNNPYVTLVAEIDEHGSENTGGDNIITFINRAEIGVTKALSNFVPVEDNWIASGDDADVPFNLPNVPGKIIGRIDGTWVSQWSFIPANYLLSIDLSQMAPLVKRVDPSDTGLGRGLIMLVDERLEPFEAMTWTHRFGFGAGHRLNGAVMELGTGGTYTVPTAYDV